MQLLVVHQILIASAIALGALFGLRSLWMFRRAHDATDLVMAIVTAITCVLLARYLKTVRAKWLAQKREQQR